jgi:hypothetical protein
MSGRKRLTRHKREVHDRLVRLSRDGTRPVAEQTIGSRGALGTLEWKGYARVERTEYGPRGGEYRYWLPVSAHPREGVDFCSCGAKYWDGDVCHSCGSLWTAAAVVEQQERYAQVKAEHDARLAAQQDTAFHRAIQGGGSR